MTREKQITRYRRINSLDKLKMLCAFLIVCIHAPFPGAAGQYFKALTRIGVPVFFMITGFFYSDAASPRQIKKLLKLILMGNGIYLVWKLIRAALKGKTADFLTKTFTLKNIEKFLLLNESHLQSHLWYLGAILYVVVIVTVLIKWKGAFGRRILYLITPFLLLGDLLLGKYSLLLFHQEFPYIFVRNWLFVGLPYFAIGMWLNDKKIQIGRWKLIGLIVLTTMTTLLERYLLVSSGLNSRRDHYLSTTFLAIAVFLFFLEHVGNTDSIISRIGRDDSTWIYILHPIMIVVCGAAAEKTGAAGIYKDIRPIIVFAVTTALVELAVRVKKVLSNR